MAQVCISNALGHWIFLFKEYKKKKPSAPQLSSPFVAFNGLAAITLAQCLHNSTVPRRCTSSLYLEAAEPGRYSNPPRLISPAEDMCNVASSSSSLPAVPR